MLHITNGESAGGSLRLSGVPGEVLAWEDVLYEGPVPAGIALAALSDVRAHFIAEAGWGRYEEVVGRFRERDTALEACAAHDEIVLWFEHDLYDQLQLVQILDWLAEHGSGGARLSLLCIGDYPVKPRFVGLGQLTPQQLAGLFPARHAVTAAELALGHAAWAAFLAPDPTAIEKLLVGDASALPFLAGALIRLLEEYPASGDGLSRTDRQILQAVEAGASTPPHLMLATTGREERPFMGDLTLWSHVYALSSDPAPLLTVAGGSRFALPGESGAGTAFTAQVLTLTDTGRAVLAGQADWITLGGVDCWHGGVHLRGPEPEWRWDRDGRRLTRHPQAR